MNQIQKCTIIGAIVNVLLAVFKIGVGIIGFSQALIADGIHSLSDLISDISIVWGAKYWNADPDEKHPYGHGRIETFVSAGIGIILMLAGFEFFKMAILTIYHDVEREPSVLVLVVAVCSVLSKEILYRWTLREGKRQNSSALVANAWHHRTDAISSIPVIVAFVATRVAENMYFVDAIATTLIAILLVKAGWDIIWPCIQELMETQMYDDIANQVCTFADEHEKICDAHNIRIRKVGNLYYIEMHIMVDGNSKVTECHCITTEMREKVKDYNQNIADITIHVEPYCEELVEKSPTN